MQNYPHVIVHAIFVKMGCFVWNWHNYAQFGRIHSLFLSVASVVFFRVAEKSRFASAEMIHADLQTDCRSGQHWNHAGSQALGKLITVFSMPLTSLLCCSCQTPSFRVRTHIHEYEYEFECTGAEKHEIQYISMAGVNYTDTSASTGTSHPETYWYGSSLHGLGF